MNQMRTKNNKLTAPQIIQFLELYEEYSCLWNIHDAAYKNKDARLNAYVKIAEEMDIADFSYQDVEAKIRSLRNAYCLEVIKIGKSKKSGAGTDDVYTPKVAWFATADRILHSVLQIRPTQSTEIDKKTCNLQGLSVQLVESDIPSTSRTVKEHSIQEPKNEVELADNNDPSTNFEDCRSKLPIDFHTNNKSHGAPQREISCDNQTQKFKTSPSHGNKRKRNKKVTVSQHIDRTINTGKSLKNEVAQNADQDEFFFFAQNIACQLRQLPIHEALQCQVDIMKVIEAKRLQYVQPTPTKAPVKIAHVHGTIASPDNTHSSTSSSESYL